jgi:hypothetical protein
MGDFNINARKYTNRFIHNHWRFKIFDFFERSNIYDTIPLFNDNHDRLFTFNSHDKFKSPSHLDYIWTTFPLLQRSLNSKIIDVAQFNTDHRIVSLSLEPVILPNIPIKKDSKLKERLVFLYDEMDKDDLWKWENFENTTKSMASTYSTINCKDINDINKYWTKISTDILNAAKQTIKSKIVKDRKSSFHPVKDSQLHNDLKFITHLLVNFYRNI